MVAHFRFVRDHQKHIKKVAVVTNSHLADVAEHRAGVHPPGERRLRDECLNINEFWSLTRARVVSGDWNHDHNGQRPHSALGYRPAAADAASCTHRGYAHTNGRRAAVEQSGC